MEKLTDEAVRDNPSLFNKEEDDMVEEKVTKAPLFGEVDGRSPLDGKSFPGFCLSRISTDWEYQPILPTSYR